MSDIQQIEDWVVAAAASFFLYHKAPEEMAHNAARFNIQELAKVAYLSEGKVAAALRSLVDKGIMKKCPKEPADYMFTLAGIVRYHAAPPALHEPSEAVKPSTDGVRIVNGSPEQLVKRIRELAVIWHPRSARSRRWDILHMWSDDDLLKIIRDNGFTTPTKLAKYLDPLIDEKAKTL